MAVSIPNVGDLAPDFTLPGVVFEGGEVVSRHFTLSAERGSPLVLAFYPADNSPACTAQLCSYQDELDRFRSLGATVWGISRQNPASHERFATSKRLEFPLLADEKGDVVSAYGVGLPGLGLRRSVFIVNAEGTIHWRHVALVGVSFQKVDTLYAQLQTV